MPVRKKWADREVTDRADATNEGHRRPRTVLGKEEGMEEPDGTQRADASHRACRTRQGAALVGGVLRPSIACRWSRGFGIDMEAADLSQSGMSTMGKEAETASPKAKKDAWMAAIPFPIEKPLWRDEIRWIRQRICGWPISLPP